MIIINILSLALPLSLQTHNNVLIICSDMFMILGIRAGTYSIIYMSPETLLNLEAWGDIILNSKIYKERVSVITIDEAHILESW